MSIVQLSRFFVCVVLFKRQLLYFIKSFCLCQELFYFSLSLFSSFPLPSHATAYSGYHFQNSLSTTFLIYFSIISLIFKSSSFLPIKNVPPPRLLSSSVPLLFSLLFLSDECYLTMPVLNCQYFLYFSCNSEYSDNSIYVCKTISFTIITDTDLYSRKFFQEPKESARIWQNAHGFFHGFIL